MPVLSKKSLAYESIKNLIATGDLQLGEIVSESALAEKLLMSRTPIREAIQLLSAEGLTKVLPKKGILVCIPSAADSVSIYELRQALELFVLRRALPLIGDADIVFFRNELEEQEKADRKRDQTAFMQSDMRLHLHFFKVYKNPLMFEIIQKNMERFMTLGTITSSITGRPRGEIIAEHTALVDFIESKNLRKAEKCLFMHFERAIRFYQPHVREKKLADAEAGPQKGGVDF